MLPTICGKTTNNIYKRFSGHKTTVNKEKTNSYLVQHCNNGMCSISDITVTILENLNKEEKNNRLRKQEDFWIHANGRDYPFGLNDRVAKYNDMSHVVVKCIEGFIDHRSFTCPTKRKNDREDIGKIIEKMN